MLACLDSGDSGDREVDSGDSGDSGDREVFGPFNFAAKKDLFESAFRLFAQLELDYSGVVSVELFKFTLWRGNSLVANLEIFIGGVGMR